MLALMLCRPPSRPRRFGGRVVLFLLLSCAVAPSSYAQGPPPPLPPVVIDVHGSFSRLPRASVELAQSRGLDVSELPGAALGGDVGLHAYPLRYRMITFGVGGSLSYSRGHNSPLVLTERATLPAVTEKFVAGDAQLSLNFGSGDGWSYLSGGIGQSVWQIIPDGSEPRESDNERLKTINYGGGARWFMKKHLAFSFDVRFYAVDPGTPSFGFPGSPRTTLMVIGAGASLKLP